MLTLEELIYISLAVGVVAGFLESLRPSRRASKAVDLLSMFSIIVLVGLMGVVVGSELHSLTGYEGLRAATATALVSALPGLMGVLMGMAAVRRH